MPLDGITAKFLSFELSKELVGARIDKINQTDSYDIYIKLRNGNQNYNLIASANPSTARLHITDENTENPIIPLRFCTVLRKYLSGGRITSIETPSFERIFHINIQTMNEIGDKDIKTLIIEIMGRYSNIILINESGRIIDCALHVDDRTSRVREVLPTRMYVAPLSQNKLAPKEVLEKIETDSFFPKQDDVVLLDQFLLNNIFGISPLFVQEFCFQSNLDPKIRLETLTSEQFSNLNTTLRFYMNKIIDWDYSPTLFFKSVDSYSPSDFHSFSLHTFPYKKEVATISSAMEEYYSRKAKNNYLSQKKAHLVKLVSQRQALLARKIIIHNSDIEECKSKELYKKYGDLILSNLHLIKPDANEISVVDYYEENLPNLTIPLQSNITGSQNAQKYYKKYNKLKSKFESVSKLLEEEIKEQEYFQTIQISLSNVDSNADIDAIKEELYEWDSRFNQKGNNKDSFKGSNKKKKISNKKPLPIPPRKFLSSDGYEILVGRNNLQNDQITTKIANKEDIWFHIQKAPGTHVVVKTNREIVPDTTIEEAAMLSAWFSKNSEASINTKSIIDYCPVRNVWKPKKSAPGHVLYRDYESIVVKILMPPNVKEI